MKRALYPQKESWESICKRPAADPGRLNATVSDILKNVRLNGDKALIGYNKEFDKWDGPAIEVEESEINEAEINISGELKDAILLAALNISTFHNAQVIEEPAVQVTKGVVCSRKSVPIEKVGLYIPGGSAPLFSTVLMLAVPASIAGCRDIILCSPPRPDGKINPAILFAAKISGVTRIFKTGGAQAIAAMAYGTETVPRVYKIFGPGNQYVTRAKEMVQSEGVAIDMPAGPSEVLVIGDAKADPEFIAADLLSQAEHGADSQVIFVTDNLEFANKVELEVEKQVSLLPRKDIAKKALENSTLVVLASLEEAIDFSNAYAPEHLIIATDNYRELSQKVINAGSVFLGRYSCESAGDYASGTNHTLPTNRYSRSYSGVSTESFVKKITFQELTSEGIKKIGPAIEVMASAEGLEGHRNAVSLRLKKIGNV